MLGRFVDATWAYRFGPPAQDLIVVSLARRRPARLAGDPLPGRPAARARAGDDARPRGGRAEPGDDGAVRLRVASDRFAYGVRVQAAGFAPDDDAFSVEPGGARDLVLRPLEPGASFAGAVLTALNLDGRVKVG